jgi:protein-tyrosine-phosphatase
MSKQKVLILCTGNSARSQMAEGLLRHDAGDRFEVESAGTNPSQVRPEAIAVMKELGIDISDHHSKHVDTVADQRFDYVLTVCDSAKESCPLFREPLNKSIAPLKIRLLFRDLSRSGFHHFARCATNSGNSCVPFRLTNRET